MCLSKTNNDTSYSFSKEKEKIKSKCWTVCYTSDHNREKKLDDFIRFVVQRFSTYLNFHFLTKTMANHFLRWWWRRHAFEKKNRGRYVLLRTISRIEIRGYEWVIYIYTSVRIPPSDFFSRTFFSRTSEGHIACDRWRRTEQKHISVILLIDWAYVTFSRQIRDKLCQSVRVIESVLFHLDSIFQEIDQGEMESSEASISKNHWMVINKNNIEFVHDEKLSSKKQSNYFNSLDQHIENEGLEVISVPTSVWILKWEYFD